MQVKNFYPLIFIFLIFLFFTLGFYLDENSAGAGGYTGDLIHIWKNQQTFNNHTLKEAINFTAIYDPEHFSSSKMPLVYILNKFLNPFADSIRNWRISIFIISCVIPFFLYFTLLQKYKSSNKYIIALISSFLFLSPYFRTSGYWGLEENFGILIFIISYHYYFKFMNDDNKNNISLIIFLTFFSSACVYADQKLVIVPLICFFGIIFSNKFFYLKFLSSLFYFIFSIPCFYLIYLWGNVLPIKDATLRNTGEIYLDNISYSITIIAFYLFPLIFVKKEKISFNFKNFFKLNLNLSLLFLFAIYLIHLIFFNELNISKQGGGIFTKVLPMLFENYLFQKTLFIFISIVSFFIILIFLNNNIHDFLIVFYFIILSVIINPLYQEYFDPIIILLSLTFFKTKLVIDFKNTLGILIYYIFLLVGSIIFYL
jgi:hypothetical protein